MPTGNAARHRPRKASLFAHLWRDLHQSRMEWEILRLGSPEAVPIRELSRAGRLTRRGRTAVAVLERLIHEGKKQNASEVARSNGRLAEEFVRQLATHAQQRPALHEELRAAIRDMRCGDQAD